MGYTIPGWLDEILDFIGINFPNVDEDDYREMATAMREFAEKFEGHGGDAHKAFSRILSSSEGWAVDSMEKHWNQIKTSHLEKLPELARLFADACDVLAEIIEWMKHKAEAELAIMAGAVGLSIGLAWVTGGLSAVLGAAEIQAMRQVVKRIIDEAVDRIVDEVIAKLTEPVNAKLEAMVEDMVLDLADGAFHMPCGQRWRRWRRWRARRQGRHASQLGRRCRRLVRARSPVSIMSSSRTARARFPGTAATCIRLPPTRWAGSRARSAAVRAATLSRRPSTACCTARSRAPRRP